MKDFLMIALPAISVLVGIGFGLLIGRAKRLKLKNTISKYILERDEALKEKEKIAEEYAKVAHTLRRFVWAYKKQRAILKAREEKGEKNG